MRVSPGSGLVVSDGVDIDWGLICAVEKLATGADIHGVRSLMCSYRNHCERLLKYPDSHSKVAIAVYEEALRSLLSGRRTLKMALKFKDDWWQETGWRLAGWVSPQRNK